MASPIESPLFNSLKLGPYTIANRVVLAPMTRCRAGAGDVPTPLMAEYYAQRASGGLLITEATQVSPQGRGYPATPGMHSPEQVEGWRHVTNAVHDKGGRIFAQLWHVGRVSHNDYQPGAAPPVSSSPVGLTGDCRTPSGPKPYPTPRPLEESEIPGVIEQYRRAAAGALAAGFDGVELHGANGYLPDQFLRDGVTQRTDRWGGSIENRARFLLDVTRAITSVWGADRVGVRLSPSGTFNQMRDSNARATFTHAVTQLGTLGLAYLHLMQPMDDDRKHGASIPGWDPIPLSFFRPLFKGVLIANGGFNFTMADAAIREGWADAVAFGVPYLANPDLPERFRRFGSQAPLNAPDFATFYGGDARGYTDYPLLP